MRRIVSAVVTAVLVALLVPAPTAAQNADVNKVLADARAALGGEKKLSAVRTFAASGSSVLVRNNQSLPPGDVETAFDLPDKFMKKEVIAVMAGATIGRTSGFNGETPINVVDQPPSGGQVFIRMAGPGDPGPGATPTPEQQEQMRKRQLVGARQEYARLALGMLLPSLPSYPLTFAYAGQAESPDGKADIVEVTGEGDFKVRLFIDATTHLPLMLSWMGREPVVMTRTVGGPGGAPPAGGNVMFGAGGQGHANAQSLPPEERERLQKQADQQMKDAEANAKMVEYRIYYGDYRDVDGIKVPFRMQRSMAGKPLEELTLDKVKINGKIDPRKFETK